MNNDIKTMATKLYPKRDQWVHKGDFGYVLIISGGRTYSGSPVFNAMGALRAGADLAVLHGHPRAMDIAASYAPDIITSPFLGEFNSSNAEEISSETSRYQSLVIGCGLERSEETFAAIRALVEKSDIPMVLDAEAIRAIAGHTEILKDKKIILTPNSEEFRILTGGEVGIDENERKEKVQRWASALSTTILLKGAVDIISDGKNIFVNKTGSVYMTKGGFGDILAGVTGALLARGSDTFSVASVAAHINGTAGDLAGQKYGEGVLASDSFDFIPLVVKELQIHLKRKTPS
ncbi:MAG: ADP-dependent (S)-NAD(P)H-hydrate dehydratase [Parcubacteria group bacterium GW2011_GWC1_42_11]|uniref:ADP-dependent (S)-NAD(P)H-hydrate dehydratase n=1 Tax=Candidatus Nomurabacteria bacterium GW2011_GWC2_42_20 TaxID=1618756 RepID=A0A0G1CC42_9BACT|nr:MAG: ADP-dependent (S)-NAD(P)H-hydrate dehydratase [Parcubacteria group bacterium GW2011_GWC1_42_11]KKS47203.1 MAG: ADP-dependent (S)-NAD(P)H-hydrate dehydratase [Candidatus Nomurabacteria bacterium GW2011_GWC2_42_20]KKS59064.1 MAG: ADP-dependent (S)-NAD(P)H-hydrate dehydratase [Candidatus Nomurabacteria bacterium GW2011_GWA2_42_41]KKT09279.1 MAG: ADP-dependent (S)-NAD(P)H-hydrate dehydratase [Candidatus Nomurabacteria bacterium GW2011_GWB1_43_20]TAN36547.1 MAG: NAD(P)H-hydrate dehydratase [